MNSLLRSQSTDLNQGLQDAYFTLAKENCKWRHKHIKTLTVFLYKRRQNLSREKELSDSYLCWLQAAKIRDQNKAKQSREPQLHKAQLDQRTLNTEVLTFSVGSLHGTCVEMQNLFTGSALKEKREFLTGFWVTVCYLIYSFRPNQSNKQGTIKGMLWGRAKIYHKGSSNHLWVHCSDHRQIHWLDQSSSCLLCIWE